LTLSLPSGAEDAGGGERAALALAAEPVVLQGDQDGAGVAVIELDDVDVGELDAGHPQRRRARGGRAGDHAEVVEPASGVAGMGLGPAADVDRGLPQAGGPMALR
jgi:hypothetical protein